MNPPPIYDVDDDEARERHDANNPYIQGLEIEAAERRKRRRYSRTDWPARLVFMAFILMLLLGWWLTP